MLKNAPKSQQRTTPRLKAYLRSDYKNKFLQSPVYIRISYEGTRLFMSTGFWATEHEWDPVYNILRASHPKHKDLNLLIKRYESNVHEIFVRYRLQDKMLTAELLKAEIQNPTHFVDFYAFMHREILNRQGEVTENTISQHLTMLNKLKEYRPSLAFSQITLEFIRGYEHYLKTVLKNNMNTIRNSMKTLKAYINLAVQQGLADDNPFRFYKIKTPSVNREYLNDGELRRLFTIYFRQELEGKYQGLLRHFLFACLTGLRISDLRAARHEDIHNNCLMVKAMKLRNVNASVTMIPLTKTARRLIGDERPFALKGLLFNCMSEPRMRLHLKEIIRYAGIDKEIKFHCARHTFATNFLEKTDDVASLQKLLGLTNVQDAMIYVHITHEKKVLQMHKFDDFS